MVAKLGMLFHMSMIKLPAWCAISIWYCVELHLRHVVMESIMPRHLVNVWFGMGTLQSNIISMHFLGHLATKREQLSDFPSFTTVILQVKKDVCIASVIHTTRKKDIHTGSKPSISDGCSNRY